MAIVLHQGDFSATLTTAHRDRRKFCGFCFNINIGCIKIDNFRIIQRNFRYNIAITAVQDIVRTLP